MSMCGVCKKDKENMKSAAICVECAEHRKKYYKNNSEKIKKDTKKWKSKNKEKTSKYRKTWRSKNKDKVRISKNKYNASPKARYRRSRALASVRGLEFSLTFDQFAKTVSQDCVYCLGAFGKVKWGIGLDRVDNSKGYIDGNVVSCCKKCNVLKSNWLSFEETKAAVGAILKVRFG